MATFKKNFQINEEMNTWYEERAKSIGISTSALMKIALQQYITQEKAINAIKDATEEMKKYSK